MSALDDIVTSDTASNIASGTEALYRGLLPKGTFDALEVGLGGAKQSEIDARRDSNPQVNAVAEFGGQVLRDSAAMALAGPGALYGLAVLNTVGDTAHAAVTHDVNLTVEHVAGTLLSEMLATTAGIAGGKALGVGANLAGKVLTATGRAVTNGVEQRAAARLAKMASDGAELKELNKAATEALQSGLYGRGRAAALKHIAGIRQEVQTGLAKMLSPFDDAAVAAANASPASKAIIDEAQPVLDRFALVRGKKLDAASLTPTNALELEEWLGKTAKDAKGEEIQALLGLKRRLKPLTEGFLAERGAAPAEIRNLQSEIAAQDAVQATIPKDALPLVGKAALKTGAMAAAGGAAGVVADLVGIPGGMVHSATALVGGMIGGKAMGKAILPELGASVGTRAAQTAYNMGQRLSNFDRGVFAQHFANIVGNDLDQTLSSAMRAGSSRAVTASALDPSHLVNLQCLAQNPEMLLKFATQAADNAPIPDEQKPQVVDTLTRAVMELGKDLPEADPMAPPGARGIPQRKQIDLARKIQAFTDPKSFAASPHPVGSKTLQALRPATHAAIIEKAIMNAGPNVAVGSHARTILDAIGFNRATQDAGRAAQGIYAAPDPRKNAGPKRAVNNTTNINYNNDASTAVDNAEKGAP